MKQQLGNEILQNLGKKPVLIAGPTASGKSALALWIAKEFGGIIINADAIQVFDNWRILTARPSKKDENDTPHALYGHINGRDTYSVGQWLRDVTPFLSNNQKPIIVGGTGLYFSTLTQGLADIPKTPESLRHKANSLLSAKGLEFLLNELDDETRSAIDIKNPMRVQRAWEVLRLTGKSILEWHRQTPPPILPIHECIPIVLNGNTDWLNKRISRRFEEMIEMGALDEAKKNLETWDPSLLSSKAIGAPELISYLENKITLDQAKEQATIATRQFAKRQRTWFRSKMAQWIPINPENFS